MNESRTTWRKRPLPMLLLAGLLAAGSLAAGCSGGTGASAPGAPSASPGSPAQADPSASAAPTAPTAPTAEPYRLISTTVAATQLADAIGLELVGIPTSSKPLPERYRGVTEVGNPMTPSMEIVKSLEPTEVLSVTTLQYDLAPMFDKAGIRATFLDFTSVESMSREIRLLGEKYGAEEKAQALIGKFDAKIEEIRQKTSGRKAPTVLILLGVPGSYLVATEKSYIGDLVRLAGGKNIVQGEDVEYLASNTEHLQQADPDVILRAAHGMPDEVVAMFDREFKRNDIWKHFSAVQQGRVYDLPEPLFPTTGTIEADAALDYTVRKLYPELEEKP